MPRENNVTQIVVGKSARSRWHELVHGSVLARADREAPTTSPSTSLPERRRDRAGQAGPAPRAGEGRLEPRPYALVASATGRRAPWPSPICSTGSRGIAQHRRWSSCRRCFVERHRATACGRPAAGGARSARCLQLLLHPAALHLRRSPIPRTSWPSLFFAIVALVTSTLAARARAQTGRRAPRQARTTAELYAFAASSPAWPTSDELLWATAHQIAAMLRVEAVILLPARTGCSTVQAA